MYKNIATVLQEKAHMTAPISICRFEKHAVINYVMLLIKMHCKNSNEVIVERLYNSK